MGPTTVNGLPAHVLLVHFVVVLVPLAALLLALAVCWPAARARLGLATPLVAFAALLAVPLTTQSGEWLAHHVDRNPLVRQHTHLGDELLAWSAATFLLASVWWALHSDRVTRRLRPRLPRIDTVAGNRAVAITLALAALAVSVGSVVQVYRIGDSGAQAAWHSTIVSQSHTTAASHH
ncbi:hypothetical protein KO481_34975 [Nocardia sp. NEAU-G5]|uniref:DUF2231 domain-containing protein n=1 Tax=Nocardia albiluteola TaxID=2842303 RepID=A0ABS6B8T0_9NOCA|nr:DUF2231 domain-containing protein [Nocardia albiluteola]MBU3066707.1 hypothetical protein [Nocardia albiluteola]